MCHFCLLSFTFVSCHPSNILSMSHAALKIARPPPMSSTTNKLHYYPTAQSRVQIRANRVQISCDIVRLSWQLVTLCYKYTSLTSRLGALRFPNRFPFFALWEMNRKTWHKKIRKKGGISNNLFDVSLSLFIRYLYFDSTYWLFKIWHNSYKYSAIVLTKTSSKICLLSLF